MVDDGDCGWRIMGGWTDRQMGGAWVESGWMMHGLISG